MNIEDKRDKGNMYYFNVLSIGDIFEYKNNVYIKTGIIKTDLIKVNAVDLKRGIWEWVQDNTDVVYLENAKVVIEWM